MHTVARSKMAADLLRGGGEVAVALALVGPGTVGSALLEQLRTQVPLLRARHGIHLQLLGITNSRTMVLDKSLDLDEWQAALLERGTDASLGALTEYLKASPAEHKAVIDCTASGYVPQHYGRWLVQGLHVVTPNKKLNSGSYADYAAVKALQRSHRAHYLYEGTVGAGLPIISTLKTLLDTGDDVGRVEGVFSGTLSYIFNNLRPGGEPFSAVVAAARRMGYTEPDPRDDLSGTDVTRKVITLARECGSRAELGDVDTESLVPQALRGDDLSPAEFMARLPEVRRSRWMCLLPRPTPHLGATARWNRSARSATTLSDTHSPPTLPVLGPFRAV